MKTKRIVALALAGALAFGGALATPVLADEAVQAATVSDEDLATAKIKMVYDASVYKAAAEKKVKEAGLEGKKLSDLEKAMTDAEKDKNTAIDNWVKLGKEKGAKQDAVNNAEEALKAPKKAWEDLATPYGLAGLTATEAEDIKAAIKARADEIEATEPAKAQELRKAAVIDSLVQAKQKYDAAVEALKDAKENLANASVALKDYKEYTEAKKAYDKAVADFNTKNEAEVAKDFVDALNALKPTLDAAEKAKVDVEGKSAKQIILALLSQTKTTKGLLAALGETPAPQPGEEPGKPGEEPGKPGEEPGKPGEEPGKPGEEPGKPGKPAEKPEVKDKDNKKNNKKAPKTGDITVLAYAGSAVLAAGAFVASKKRK
nr:hypothetical protein [Murdochiella vaginalis]